MTGYLQNLVSSRSWQWLAALCAPMSLEVRLLDLTLVEVPLHPPRPGVPREALDHDTLQRLRPAAEAAISVQGPQVARLDASLATVSAVRVGGQIVGVMLALHRDTAADGSERRHFPSVVSWLRTAVEQHLASPSAGADQLGVLIQALRPAALSGSDRRLVSVFAEALAVWHDIEVVGYVETSPGIFTRAVSLAGRTQDLPPLVFPPQAIPAALQLTRMPRSDVHGGDRSAAGDVLVVTLTRGARTIWLLTLAGEIEACSPALLSSYVSALDITLALTARAAGARLALATTKDLAALDYDPPRALERALSRTRQTLAADAARFAARNVSGAAVLTARTGKADATTSVPQAKLTIEGQTSTLGRFAFEVDRNAGGPWTPVEHAQARAVADLLEQWAERRQPADAAHDADAFARTIDQHVERTLSRGEAVTLAILKCSPIPTAQQAEALLAESRRFLRDGDEAGLLPDGDLAFLLTQTAVSEAAAVTRRLRSHLAYTAAAAGIAIVSEASATRMPGPEVAGSLLHEARPDLVDPGPPPG